jgi:hypothetical protein
VIAHPIQIKMKVEHQDDKRASCWQAARISYGQWLTKDNVLQISVENCKKYDVQQPDNCIKHQVTQIRNLSIITDRNCYMKHLVFITFLIKTLITLTQRIWHLK